MATSVITGARILYTQANMIDDLHETFKKVSFSKDNKFVNWYKETYFKVGCSVVLINRFAIFPCNCFVNCWHLSPKCGYHECAYALTHIVILALKWNRNRSVIALHI